MRRSLFARFGDKSRDAAPFSLVACAAIALVIGQAGAAVAAPAANDAPGGGRPQAPLTAAQAAKLSRDVSQHVIVLLRHQPAIASGSSARSALSARSATIASSQRALAHELSQVHAKHVIGYRLVNAMAATVSPGEEARLKANPAVAQVIPDAVIQGPSSAMQPAATPSQKIAPLRGACLPRGRSQLEPEALQLTNTQSLNPRAQTARKLGFNGAGVTVAYLADGIDINNVNFIRRNGKSVFTDYKDFTGDGTRGPSTGGGEAFLDANSIAGQGRHVYNVQFFGPQTLTEKCNIKIEGVAPGANIVGLRIFGFNNFTTTSSFLDAINYATVVHPVNVINESFGGNEIPDTSVDAIKEFDDAAVKAGITVVASSGDAAPGTDTIGSPATDPNVVSVGASTAFRAYAMANFFEADKFGRSGWLDNNISAISSTGFDSFGAGIDVVAPGDATFTSCTATNNYPDCFNDKGQASAVQLTGGTSESAPLTSGVAALVIQAYRKTHGGTTPTPATVKQIIMSSAKDIRAGGSDQGAGLVNAYKAVQLAESFGGGATVGDTLETSVASVTGQDPASSRPGQIDIQDLPNTPETGMFSITNTGTHAQTVHLSSRRLAAPRFVVHSTVTLSNARSGHFVDFVGFKDNYAVHHFTVRPGQNRLNVAMAYPVTRNTESIPYLILISPTGKFAANSLPQGFSQEESVQVTNPRAGRWTAVVFGPRGGRPAFGVTGRIHLTTSTQRFVSFGHLSTSTALLAPGASTSVTLAVSTPRTAGDQAGSVVINGGHGASTIPVMLRSYVNAAAAGGGTFSGSLAGGNGRGVGQFNYYQFPVGAGNPSITATLKLANDRGNLVDVYLVDPSGEIDGYGSNYIAAKNSSGFTVGLTADASAVKATSGIWELVVQFVEPTGGNETSDGFTGRISFTAGATVTGAPDGVSIPAGTSKTFNVSVTNNGNSTEDVFLDPRLDAPDVSVSLLPFGGVGSNTVRVPMDGSVTALPQWLIPTESSSVTTKIDSLTPIAPTTSAFPISFDLSPFLGDPDVPSFGPGTVASATAGFSLQVPGQPAPGPITAGAWGIYPAPPAQDGFTTADKQAENASFSASVQTEPFDTAVDSSVGTTHVGDFWQTAWNASATSDVTFAIAPGQTATFTVTIKPTASAGTTVDGFLYVDDFTDANVFGQTAGSELAVVPYSYTVTS